jgi:hypothetical protein
VSLFLGAGAQAMSHAEEIKNHFDKIWLTENKVNIVNRPSSTHIMSDMFTYNYDALTWIGFESPLTTLLSDLRDLLKEDNEDDYGILKPTAHAFTTVLGLIMGASRFIHAGCPFAAVSTDSEGGIRIEWVKGKAEIRLVIPASSNKAPYIYYEFDDKYGVDRNANALKLIRWINRLNSYGTNAAPAYVSTITL